MNRLRQNLTMLVGFSVIFSCAKESGTEENYKTERRKTFSAVIESPETKTALNGVNVVWQKTDVIAVFDGWKKWRNMIYDGIGTTKATFIEVRGDDVGTEDFTSYVAFYPYDSVIDCSENNGEYSVMVSLPSQQSYEPTSFGTDTQPMVAVSENRESYDKQIFSFKNLYGVLKLQLKGGGGEFVAIRRICISGNNGEIIAGKAKVTCSNRTEPKVEFFKESDISNTILLDCGESGLVIRKDECKDFYIALPPIEFSKGFTMRVEMVGGDIVTKSTTGAVDIERSKILPMPRLAVFGSKQQSNQILYSTSDGKTIEWKRDNSLDSNSWPELISNEYVDGQGVLTFEKSIENAGSYYAGVGFYGCKTLLSVTFPKNCVRNIGNDVFAWCENLKYIDLPKSVTNISSGAFRECSSMTFVNMPGVTNIAMAAFMGCRSLKNLNIPENVTWIGNMAFSNCPLKKIKGAD